MTKAKKLREEFETFHAENPRVYELVNLYTARVIDRGYKKFSIGCIWENIRMDMLMETLSLAPFKLPNNHRAYYARMWLADNPDFPKYFETSELRSETGGHRDRWGRPDVHEQETMQ